MKRSHLVLSFITSLLILALASASPSPSRAGGRTVAEVRRAIDAGSATWQKAFRTLDAAAIAGTFDEEGVNVGADGTCSKGRAAIEAGMRSFFERSGPATTTKVEVKEVVLDGDLAYESGHSEFHFGPKPGGPAERAGRYLAAWKRQADGGWKLYRNLGLPDRP
jgi:uncharacterized protein (TIGR02246 family)